MPCLPAARQKAFAIMPWQAHFFPDMMIRAIPADTYAAAKMLFKDTPIEDIRFTKPFTWCSIAMRVER